MISNAISPSTPSCFFTLLEHTILPAQIVYILSWDFFLTKRFDSHGNFENFKTISRQNATYLCSLLWNFKANYKAASQFALKFQSKLQSTIWNFKANYKAQFEISKQTAKHTLQFQFFLCSFHQTAKYLCSLPWNCKASFAVCFETAKCALQFALKFQSKLQSCFVVCFEISKQTAKVLCILPWNCQNSHENHIFFEEKITGKEQKVLKHHPRILQ